MSKEEIRKYGYGLGVDAVGFASIQDYKSERSPDPKSILPEAKSIVVLGHRMIDGALDGENPRINMAGRMAVMDTSKHDLYLMAKFVEKKFKVRAATVLPSYPLVRPFANNRIDILLS
jgi:hypothetical protein